MKRIDDPGGLALALLFTFVTGVAGLAAWAIALFVVAVSPIMQRALNSDGALGLFFLGLPFGGVASFLFAWRKFRPNDYVVSADPEAEKINATPSSTSRDIRIALGLAFAFTAGSALGYILVVNLLQTTSHENWIGLLILGTPLCGGAMAWLAYRIFTPRR